MRDRTTVDDEAGTYGQSFVSPRARPLLGVRAKTDVWVHLTLNRPMKLLRIFPPLQANSIIGITLALAKDLPEELYRELVKHPVNG